MDGSLLHQHGCGPSMPGICFTGMGVPPSIPGNYFTGMGVDAGMGTAETLFFGEPSISLSE